MVILLARLSTSNSCCNEHHWDQDLVSVIERVCNGGGGGIFSNCSFSGTSAAVRNNRVSARQELTVKGTVFRIVSIKYRIQMNI